MKRKSLNILCKSLIQTFLNYVSWILLRAAGYFTKLWLPKNADGQVLGDSEMLINKEHLHDSHLYTFLRAITVEGIDLEMVVRVL